MAFAQQEQEIIRWGLQNGKTRQEVEQALVRFRTGTPTPAHEAPQAEPSLVSKYAGGVADAAKAGVEKIASSRTETRNPIESAEAALKVGAGAAEIVTSPLAPLFSPIGKLIGYVSDKISNNKAVQDFAQSPAGETTARVAEDVSNASIIAGTVAGGRAAPGAARATASLVSKGEEFLQGIKSTGTQGIRESSALGIDSASIMQRVARLSKQKQVDFEKTSGESVGKYLVNRGIFGNVDKITEQLYKRYETSRGQVDKSMAQLKGEFKSTAVGNALKQLVDRERRVSSPGALSRDLERVVALEKKHNGAGLNMAEVNEVKRLYERNVKLDYMKENLTDKVAMANNVDSAVRSWQFSKAEALGFKNLKELNKETQAARQLLDDLGAEYAGSAANNAVTLTDWIVLAGGDPTAVGAFLTKKALSSKTIMSKVAETFAPAPTRGTPKAQLTAPTIDDYLKFLEATAGRATQQ